MLIPHLVVGELFIIFYVRDWLSKEVLIEVNGVN